MNQPAPLQSLYDVGDGAAIPLPADLDRLYGPLRLSVLPARPLVIANFVQTLDGVVALDATPTGSGSAISGASAEDRVVMGLLRAVADVIVVGAGTQRSIPGHRWTAERIYPPLAPAYRELRLNLGKAPDPLNVVVTARGNVDPTRPLFRSGDVPVLVVTTPRGAVRLADAVLSWPATSRVVVASETERLTARQVLDAVHVNCPARVVLVEGGPRLLASFVSERALDELFLTVAPQIVGRGATVDRPGLVAGLSLAPRSAHWGTLVGVKRAGSHLFLRYRFASAD